MKNKMISIVKGAENFADRIDEAVGNTSYDYVKSVISRLKDALYANKEAPALCAPQIGETLRLFVVRNGHKDQDRFKVFLNPMIVSSKGLHLSREINISLPDKEFIIPRSDEVHVAFQTPEGYIESETFKGAYAEVIQQTIQMLDGITLMDYGLDLDDVGGAAAFDKASNKDKTQVLSMYIEHLKSFTKELAEQIDADPILKEINDSIDFEKEVLMGNIKPNYVDTEKEGNN